MSYYHYTKGCHLPSIVKDGIIKTSKNFLDKNEKPAAWLTKSPDWDVACNIGKVLNGKDLVSGQYYSTDQIDLVPVNNDYMKNEIGMCRILVSEDLPTISWAKFRYASGISENSYTSLDSHFRSIGSPVEKWLCTFKNIPCKYWEGIEMFVDDQWVRWDGVIPIDQFVDLCLSCNGKENRENKSNGLISNDHCQNQLDFINKYRIEIIKFWLANKDKKGYIEIYITPDYKPYESGFSFIEKRIKKSSFKILTESKTKTYAFVHFLWEATLTHHKLALAYEMAYCKSNNEIKSK